MKQGKENRGVPHTLYRGTWVLTFHTAWQHGSPACFNPLYRGTWVLTFASVLSPGRGLSCWFQSAISRYLGSDATWYTRVVLATAWFQSAISRYLGSDTACVIRVKAWRKQCFNPLYRGTWVLTLKHYPQWLLPGRVSIRYIAVLGL